MWTLFKHERTINTCYSLLLLTCDVSTANTDHTNNVN